MLDSRSQEMVDRWKTFSQCSYFIRCLLKNVRSKEDSMSLPRLLATSYTLADYCTATISVPATENCEIYELVFSILGSLFTLCSRINSISYVMRS